MDEMPTTRIEYPTGREVLAAYWGFIGNGGLVLPVSAERSFLGEGDRVLLNVKITSLKKEYQLAGRVRGKADGRAFIAFDAGQGQDAMLNAAWADSQGVPERRHRRVDVSVPVRYRIGNAEANARMVNVSRGGCCVETDETVRPGTRLALEGDGFAAQGRVRWTSMHARVMGIEFSALRDDLARRFAGDEGFLPDVLVEPTVAGGGR
jgi:hypothetical protein